MTVKTLKEAIALLESHYGSIDFADICITMNTVDGRKWEDLLFVHFDSIEGELVIADTSSKPHQ